MIDRQRYYMELTWTNYERKEGIGNPSYLLKKLKNSGIKK
jgi:hypothetical protein